MTLTAQIKEDLQWWINSIPTALRLFVQTKFDTEIYTDASLSGWGAIKGDSKIYSFWNDKMNKHSINYKELLQRRKKMVLKMSKRRATMAIPHRSKQTKKSTKLFSNPLVPGS